MIPGKKYKPEDLAEIAWRRRWYIVVPLVVIAVGTGAMSQMLPNRYESQATILIVPPQVPKDYVKPTITEGMVERLNGMQQQILSHTRLERMILDFDLYKADRKTGSMDDIIERMRRDDIKVNVAKTRRRMDDPVSFTVSYESEDPKAAMLVTERLASLFVQENLEQRSNLSETTNRFLQSQVDDALRKVHEQGAKLEAFRRANVGRLPTEVQSNLTVMQTTQQQLQGLYEAINRDRERQLVIERTLSDESALASVTVPMAQNASGRGGAQIVMSPSQELAAARQSLSTLELRLKPDHPDIKSQKRRIAELEQKVAADALQQPVSEGALPRIVTSGDVAEQRRLAGLRTEHESLGRSIITKRQQAEGLEKAIAGYRTRVEVAPTLESELTQLTRDFDTMQESYTSLLRKMQDAQVAANLEERQVGQQFRIIESARMPEHAASPHRGRMTLMGICAGLVLGLGLAAFLEYRDSSLRTEDDVLIALSLPVVALVPVMWTTRERRSLRRRRLLLASSAAAMVAVSFAALAWKLRLFEDWIR